jgi:hypothetical protein
MSFTLVLKWELQRVVKTSAFRYDDRGRALFKSNNRVMGIKKKT